MRSSTSRPPPGAPATSISLPPSRLMSLSRKVTPRPAQASCALRTTASSASARVSGPSRAEQVVGAGELDEGHARRCGAPSSPRPPGGGPASGGDNSSATSSSPTSTVPADDCPSGGRRRSRRPSPTASPASAGWQQRGRGLAQHDLAGRGQHLHLGAPARGRPADDELAVDLRVADEEEVEPAAVHAHRHAQAHPAGRRAGPPDRAQLAAHVGRGADRPDGVLLAA